jgi:UDP-N-acetylglucosamine 2-epimerase (non-hydrolysing)
MLDDLGIQADRSLSLMKPNQTPGSFLGAAIAEISQVLRVEQPNWVAVQGDTTTALAGAIGGFYERIPVLHVEAGLRTYDLDLPFPEEGHRQLISRVASAHAAPTQVAADMLIAENISASRVLVSGNTGIDCLLKVTRDQQLNNRLPRTVQPQIAELFRKSGERNLERRVVLVTLHRRESFGVLLEGMCRSLKRLANAHPTITFIFPVHPNPAVSSVVTNHLGAISNLHLVPPQPYTAFAWIMKRVSFIITDSGGIQEEGPALGKPVLVVRDVTERPEAVRCGSAKLIGCKDEDIFSEASTLLQDVKSYDQMAKPRFPYGDGTAAVKIMEWINKLEHSVRRTKAPI